jgi:hypothetical protein
MNAITQPAAIADLLGLWRRVWIRWPDGREDAISHVYWLQGSRCYADIRLPADRPSFEGVNTFAGLSKTQVDWLAKQEGFAGELRREDDAWLWKRDVNYQPPSNARDIGRLNFVDGSQATMLEEGMDEPYTELWERLDTGGDSVVLRTPDSRGFLVVGGSFFLMALDHRPPLPVAGSLGEIIAEVGVENALNMEISLGDRRTWMVNRSTLPWREGRRLVDPGVGKWDLLEGQAIDVPPFGPMT